MKLFHLLLIFILIVVWGFNFVVVKFGLDGFPPLFLGFARFFLTSIPAVFFLKRPPVPFWRIARYGLVIFSLQFALFFLGMYLGIPPGLAAILQQFHVLVALTLGAIFFQEKIKPLQIMGALLSFSGIAFIGLNGEGHFSLTGFFFILGAAICWGTGSALSKTIGPMNMVSLIAWAGFVAWPPLLLLSLLIEGPAQMITCLSNLSWLSCSSVLYITYFSTLFGYGLWSWLLNRYPISTVAPFSLLVPLFAMLFSSLIVGEPLQSWKIQGSFLVISGLAINCFSIRLTKKSLEEKIYRRNNLNG